MPPPVVTLEHSVIRRSTSVAPAPELISSQWLSAKRAGAFARSCTSVWTQEHPWRYQHHGPLHSTNHNSKDSSKVMGEKRDKARMENTDFINSGPVFNSSVPLRSLRI